MVQGSGIDSNLNELGRLQSNSFYEKYKHISFDKIYLSKLKRTYQTVKPFIDLQIPFQKLEGLNELSWGAKEGRPLTPIDDINYQNILNGWRKGYIHLKEAGGESPLDVAKRQKIALKYIFSNNHEKNILICMHGRAMRCFLSLLLDTPLSQMDQYEHSNTSLYVLKQDHNSNITLEIKNCSKHLVHIPVNQLA